MTKSVTGILGQLAPAATTLTSLYTVPDRKRAEVSVIVANRGAQTTFRVLVGVNGAATENKQYLSYDEIIAANKSIVSHNISLEEKDEIRVYAGSANLSFAVTGLETPK